MTSDEPTIELGEHKMQRSHEVKSCPFCYTKWDMWRDLNQKSPTYLCIHCYTWSEIEIKVGTSHLAREIRKQIGRR